MDVAFDGTSPDTESATREVLIIEILRLAETLGIEFANPAQRVNVSLAALAPLHAAADGAGPAQRRCCPPSYTRRYGMPAQVEDTLTRLSDALAARARRLGSMA